VSQKIVRVAEKLNEASSRPTPPKDGFAGLKENFKGDALSGFIVFLIALPLCLGIAMASGVPPLAGIIGAVVGGMVVSLISGSHVTINGPAAGLIVVILGAVESLGGGTVGYHCALAAIMVSGAILTLLGFLRAGILCEFFPSTVVHGLLASIGIIIMSKQLHVMLGVAPHSSEPLKLLHELPNSIAHANPAIALIAFASIAILVAHTLIKNKSVKRIPAPLIVIAVSLAFGAVLGLNSSHGYTIGSNHFHIEANKFLVKLPTNIMEGITQPDFSKCGTYEFWLAVLGITLIQGIETLLSGAAVDKLDKFKRHSNLSRDMSAIGFGSMISASIGGLPMIAEIVRSTANIDNGARTRWSNFFHGTFMLVFVVLAGALLNQIPLAALAALLVFTGFRLASPRVFLETYKIGKEQFTIFVTTIAVTLCTDLLIGVTAGIATTMLLHIVHGAKLNNLFRTHCTIQEAPNHEVNVQLADAAIFSNYISLKQQLDTIPPGLIVHLDLSRTQLIDHTVMERLEDYKADYNIDGGYCEIGGLNQHITESHHPLAARRLPVKSA
jgi:MFS superfamily sulfate permease-like transporter